MSIPLEIVDHAKLVSQDLSEHIRERTDKLAHFFERVKRCRVTVDGPGEHPLQGRVRVRVTMLVPGAKIAIDRQSGATVAIAIRESFDAADQRLEDYVRQDRNAVQSAKKRSLKRV